MIYYTYPGFRNKALTISYDDGLWSDVHLLEILNRYGIQGTFNLNSGCMTEERRIGKEKIPALYKGHEIATGNIFPTGAALLLIYCRKFCVCQ